jgi:type III secretory pathway component EscV
LTSVGAVVGAVILLSVIVVLILIMAYLVRKHKKRDSGNGRDSEMRTSVAEKTTTVDIEVDTNPSYIPLVTQITTENNIAYGEVTMNQDGNDLYEILDPPIKDSTTQFTHVEQSEDEHYDYIC